MSRYETLLENADGILSNTRKFLSESKSLSKSIQEVTKLIDTNTPNFKEGLVVYFSGLPTEGDLLSIAKQKLAAKDTNYKIDLPLPDPSTKNRYDSGDVAKGKSFDAVAVAIKHLNEDELTPKDKEFYYNAISISEEIRGNFTPPVIIDRGADYTSVRNHAVKLIKKEYEISTTADKWCPADIFIYNESGAADKATKAISINQGEDSLNALFQVTDKKTNKGILGISLKEEKAQAGKAGSFRNILTRKENYKTAPGLPETLENILLLFYNLRSAKEAGTGKSNYNLQGKIDSIRYLVSSYNASNRLIKLGFKGGRTKNGTRMADISTQLKGILEKEVKKSILNSSKSANGYDPKKIKDALEQKFSAMYNSGKYKDKFGGDLKLVPLKKHVMDDYNDLVELTKKTAKFINEEVRGEYEAQRKAFIGVLKKQGFSKPTTDGKPLTSTIGVEIEEIETLLKKARCYSTAEWMMSGLNTEDLQIPPAYKTIMKQKNAFVALTAFAIGMAGISPTFYKYKGNKSGGAPTVEPFWGNGFLSLEGKESEVKITDNDSNKGFRVEFNTFVTLQDVPGSEIVGKYKVTLDFRYAGEQINIEVQNLEGQH